jgi:hypothetical protein
VKPVEPSCDSRPLSSTGSSFWASTTLVRTCIVGAGVRAMSLLSTNTSADPSRSRPCVPWAASETVTQRLPAMVLLVQRGEKPAPHGEHD